MCSEVCTIWLYVNYTEQNFFRYTKWIKTTPKSVKLCKINKKKSAAEYISIAEGAYTNHYKTKSRQQVGTILVFSSIEEGLWGRGKGDGKQISPKNSKGSTN